MSGLEVRSGGPHSVETEALIGEAVRLAAVAHIVAGWAARAAALRAEADRLATDPGSASAADGAPAAGIDLDTAHAGLASAERAASDLSTALGLGATRYVMAEGLVAGLVEAGRRVGAGVAGLAASGLLLPAASAAALALGPIALGGTLALAVDPDRHAEAVGAVLARHGLPILSDPAFVELVRVAADQADELLAGLFRAPGLFAIGPALDAPENAGLVLAAAGVVGLVTGSRGLRETAISAPIRTSAPDLAGQGGRGADGAAPVRGIADLAERIPPSDARGPQVRIERYDTDRGAHWIVYSAGTADFGMEPAREPYDMTANLHGVAGASVLHDLIGLPSEAAASERALRAAMAEAGVEPGDPVIVVGHSAGGMVAANVAADPDLDVVAAVSLGGPVAQVPTGDTPLLSVAHGEDLVPATAGSGVAAGGRIEVGRSLGALDPGTGGAVPAHSIDRYRETARLIDRDDDPRLAEFRDLVTGFTDGAAPAEVSYWRVERAADGRGR
ncbi:hypothetical protein GCM10017608_04120 [Agromyces luteolus]|uniref:Uncharacterized protein n=1 Tax=Agromyces luteolus TaxID=88373 RepID=A0A7C9HG17_9MICO|nr:hypothetical protein [Agromyces luteolus]MUN05927.1 hypothetical protein [Agromyces luteolus]GLK26480.1 hypothetical protein GCM10017608_04120 [Agromyces luteolus]